MLDRGVLSFTMDCTANHNIAEHACNNLQTLKQRRLRVSR